MTNPYEPPNDGAPRPAGPGDHRAPGPPIRPSEAPTRNFQTGSPPVQGSPQAPRGYEAPTVAHRLPQHTEQPQQTEQLNVPYRGEPQGGYPPPPIPPAGAPGQPAAPPGEPAPAPTKRRLRKPLIILLICAIIFAVALVGLVGAEFYARNQAESKLAGAVACQAKDQATVTFGAFPPVLWQVINKDFTNISVQTAGNQLGSAKGMKADISVQDVNLNKTANSSGTLGALDGTVTWSSEGIKETVAQKISEFSVKDVTPNPNDGTLQLKGTLITVVIKPQVSNGKLSVQIVSVTVGKGFLSFPLGKEKEKAQSKVDDMTDKLSNNAPLGIHVDSVQVTDSGVTAHFSTHNATLPASGQNACFANL